MTDKDPTPIENALDWLLHSAMWEIERDDTETVRTVIVPEALLEYRRMQKEIERLTTENANLRSTAIYGSDFIG